VSWAHRILYFLKFLRIGRPRSHLPQQGRIPSQDVNLPQGGVLRTHPYPDQQSLPAFVPPKKAIGSRFGSQVVIGNSIQRQFEDSEVATGMGMRPRNDSNQSLKFKHPPQLSMTPPKAYLSSPPNTAGLGFEVKTQSVQPSHRESDSHVRMRPQVIQANKSSALGTLSSSQNTGLRLHETNRMSYQPQVKGSDDDVSMRSSDNYSRQPAVKMPELEPSLSPPNTGTMAMSADPRLKYCNVDVSRSDSDGPEQDVWSLLRGLSFARKRFRDKNPLPSVEEEVVSATRKKTRLGWGQGLAKYEKEKREN
jgi:hypothetical protein